MFQTIITPAAGKRLIAKAVCSEKNYINALKKSTVVIIAGTTNGYLAEETLKILGITDEFTKKRFFRGITMSPGVKTTDRGRLPDESSFPGDVVIKKGQWLKGKTIFDAADDLKEGDIICKGANCINQPSGKAGLLIGHPKGGTILAALQAVAGRRVRLIIPAGLEKRIDEDIDTAAFLLNKPGVSGPRLLPVNGELVTELEAVKMLSGAEARLVSAGGVCGAEGSVWLAVSGTEKQEKAAKKIINGISNEPLFSF